MRKHAGDRVRFLSKLVFSTTGMVAISSPLIVGALNAARLQVQSPAAAAGGPAFEVASIKPNKSEDAFTRMQAQPGGRINITNATLHSLILTAYHLQGFQIVGGPSWTNSDRFDIVECRCRCWR